MSIRRGSLRRRCGEHPAAELRVTQWNGHPQVGTLALDSAKAQADIHDLRELRTQRRRHFSGDRLDPCSIGRPRPLHGSVLW